MITDRLDQIEWESFSEKDWENILLLVDRERIGPIVYWYLKSHNPTLTSNLDYVAEKLNELRSHCKELYYQTIAKNSQLFSKLTKILYQTSQEQIPLVLLKGSAVARLYYENIGLRPMWDFDILCPSEYIDELIGVMRANKYQLQIITNHAVFWSDDRDSNQVEIHWGFWRGERSQYIDDWYWDNMVSLPAIDNKLLNRVFVLTPAANLAYQIHHLYAKHANDSAKLLWLYDIYLLLKKKYLEIDQKILSKYIYLSNTQKDFLHAFTCMDKLFGMTIPHDLFKLVSGTPNGGKLEHVTNSRSSYSSLLNSINQLPIKYRIISLLTIIKPSPMYLRWRYSLHQDKPLIFYYLLRLKDLMGIVVSFMFHK